MVDVILKRDFRTPVGRFAKSVNGVPTQIPKRAIDRWPLPKDAVVVDKNYRSPQQIRDELGRGVDDDAPKMTAAQMEAEIEDRVKARMQAIERGDGAGTGEGTDDTDPEHHTSGAKAIADKKAKEAKEKAQRILDDAEKELDKLDKTDGSAANKQPEDKEPVADTLLDKSVADIVPELKDMDEAQLQTLLSEEQAGKTRSTLVVEIEAAIEDLQQG